MSAGEQNLDSLFMEIEVTPEGWPAHFSFFLPEPECTRDWFPEAARPESGRAAGGRGLTKFDCRRSGLGEAVEIASCCAWGDETFLFESFAELGHQAISPSRLNGFTSAQIDQRAAWNAKFGALDWRPPSAPAEKRLAWIEARDPLTDEVRLVPAEAVLIGLREPGDAAAVCIADTCGCASGPSPMDAELRALLELIERDAIGRWWYGKRDRPQLPIELIEDEPVLVAFLRNRARSARAFDITSDLDIPAVAAVSWDADGRRVCMGFSSRMTFGSAMKDAMIEMLQGEIALDQRSAVKDPMLEEWQKAVSAEAFPVLTPVSPRDLHESPVETEASRDRCLAALHRAGCETYFVDQTRPEFGVPVVRAISPSLCRDKPRWERTRLLRPDPRDLSEPPCFTSGGEPPNPVPLMV